MMKKMIKTASAALLAAAMLLSLAACAGGGKGEVTTAPDTLPETTAIPAGYFDGPAEPVVILTGSDAPYKLVRPDITSDEVIALLQKITRTFTAETGNKYLSIGTDWVKADEDPSSYAEILLGYTSRQETADVMSRIGVSDYAIVTVGPKIVIAAHTPETLALAVDRFCTDLSFEEIGGEKCAVWKKDVYHAGENSEPLLIPDTATLSEYRIVYPAGSSTLKTAAETLAKAIKKYLKAELEVTTDSKPRAGREIVIGKAARDIVKKNTAYLRSVDTLIEADPATGDLLIAAGSDQFATYAVDEFISKFINGYYSPVLLVPASFSEKKSAYKTDDKAELAEGADIRIMSFNLLCELWDDKVPIEEIGRHDSVMAILSYYAPDVVGLQEMSDKWYTALDKKFGSWYAFTDRKNEKGQTNFSTLAYNTEKVKLIEHGTKIFSQGNNTKLRLATWGLFERIADGRRFVVMTTHWDLGRNPQYQEVHSKEMAEIAVSLKNRFNLPVITTGDYNANESTVYIKNFLSKTGFHEAKYTADEIKLACKTYHTFGVSVSTAPADSIDHIFGSPDAKFLFYTVVVSQLAINSSDHCPIYADVKLGG